MVERCHATKADNARRPLHARSTERSRALTAYHVPAATAGRTAGPLSPTLARSSVSRRPVPFLFLQKEKCLNSPGPFGGEERAEESHGLDVSCRRGFAAARLVSVRARASYGERDH
jgi:hypothetical protein